MRDNVKELFDKIYKGKRGLNIGLNTGMLKLDSITSGIQRESFTLIGGATGSGKSSIALYMALYNAFLDYLKSGGTTNIHWLIFSWELSRDELLTRVLSTHIYNTTGRTLSIKNIFSRNSVISDADLKLIEQYVDWLDELDSRVTIIDNYCTAKGMYAILMQWVEQFGKFSAPDQYGRKKYTPNDENQYLIVMVDHVGLVKQDVGNTKKQEIDLASEFLITAKNRCALSVYMVQQLNRGFQSMERRTAADGRYQGVEMQDFADSSGTQNAATVVLGMFYPWREKCVTYHGYNIKDMLKDRARSISVLKNRYGEADKTVTACFFGEIGLWRELPKSEEMRPEDYEHYLKL